MIHISGTDCRSQQYITYPAVCVTRSYLTPRIVHYLPLLSRTHNMFVSNIMTFTKRLTFYTNPVNNGWLLSGGTFCVHKYQYGSQGYCDDGLLDNVSLGHVSRVSSYKTVSFVTHTVNRLSSNHHKPVQVAGWGRHCVQLLYAGRMFQCRF